MPTGLLDDMADPLAGQRSMRGPMSEEQLSGGGSWPFVLQILCECRPDIGRHGQSVNPTPLAHDGNLAGSPIHILKGESANFQGPQSQTSQ
jgi:hypothetical protein